MSDEMPWSELERLVIDLGYSRPIVEDYYKTTIQSPGWLEIKEGHFNPLMAAAARGHLTLMAGLFKTYDPAWRTSDGWSAIYYAIASHQYAATEVLLPKSDRFAKDSRGFTFLDCAIEEKDVAIVSMITDFYRGKVANALSPAPPFKSASL